MQINFNQLSITEIFKLSKHIKEKCINLSSFEEVAQELMKVFYSSFVTEGGRSPFVLARFFKSCAYGELPDDIRNYIHNKESKGNLISGNKYLTLFGSFGELDNWKNRNLSENYKAFPIHDEHMLGKFPMLSAVFDQIGLNLSHLKQTDKSILIKDCHRQYGVFCVENAEGSNLIPKQAEFVRPYSVKSVFGFGGIYSTSNVYAVIIFSRERLSRKDAQLFLSLNPAIKQITLAHEITGNIFKTDRKDTNASVDGICDEIPTVQIRSQNKTISRQHKDIIEKEMALTSSIELEMANEYLLQMSEALKKSHEQLEDKVRKRTHEFNESKEQIQLLLDSTGEAIYGLDNDGNCNFANVSCLRILRYKEASQLIGENMHDLIHHTKQDGTPYPIEECCIYQAFREGISTHIDDEVLWRADGTRFPVEYMSYPIRKENKIIGAVVTFSDITERKKIESELRESEERYRILVRSVKDYAIFMTTPDGIINSWNEGVKEIKGYNADEIIGKHISIFYPEEDIKQGKIEYELQKAREDGEYEDEGWRVRKDGSRFWANVVITALYDEDRTLKGYTEVTRDFTERIKNEEEIKSLSKFPSENPYPVLRVDNNGTILFSNKPGSVILDLWVGCCTL